MNRLTLTFFAGFLIATLMIPGTCLATPAVNVTLGTPQDQTTTRVETPNLSLTPQQNSGTKGSSSPPVPPSADPDKPLPDLKLNFPHIFGRSIGIHTTSQGRRQPMDQVLQSTPPPVTTAASGPLTVNGPGTGERIARTDGEATIKPMLSTYTPASYIVRLIDVNGQEITYNGKPLFIWTRPDDKKRSPCEFEGKPVAGSMKPNGSTADWSPVEGLTFRVQLKAGQRLRIETRGKPESSSHLTLQSSTF